jgi:DNA gyrase inhibitor GyrI
MRITRLDYVDRINRAVDYAVQNLDRPLRLELRALDWPYFTWLPRSGFAPAHSPAFEAFNGQPFAHGMEHFELRLQLPIVDGSIPV